MLALTLLVLMAVQAAPLPAPDATLVAPLVIQPNRPPPPPPPVGEIIGQWNQLAKTQPDRMVCVVRASTGSRIRRPRCATLRDWYGMQRDRQRQHGEAPLDEPPAELVDLITDYYAKADNRLRAVDRLRERQAAEADGATP